MHYNKKQSVAKEYCMQSDIMIVKMSNNDYYVSEKLHDKEPYYKLLIIRSQTSKHFTSFIEARIAAQKMRKYINKRSPDCVIVEIDIKDYPKNGKPKKYIVVSSVYDDDELVAVITDKGDKIIEFATDFPYKYIDIIKYKNKLDNKRPIIRYDEGFNFTDLGKDKAYDLSYNHAIPSLRYEVYKTKNLVKEFEYDKELHQFDIEYYLGYISGLKEAITIQKDCVLEPRDDWQIHIFDLDNLREFCLEQKGIDLIYGEYQIHLHKTLDNLVISNQTNEIFIFYINKDVDKTLLLSKCGIIERRFVVFDMKKDKQPITNHHIEQLVEKLFKLGN